MIELLIIATAVAATFSTYLLLLLIDVIVNQHLYRYGLQFNLSWANPYRMYLRISLVLLLVVTIAIIALTAIVRLQKTKLKTGIEGFTQRQKKLRGAGLFIAVIGGASVFSIYLLLFSINRIINGTLYQYGLQYSDEWANFYWMCWRGTLILLGVMAIVIISLTATVRRQEIKPSEEEFWPKEAEEISDHELMMKIFNSSKGGSMKLDEIRNLLPTRIKPPRIKPALSYVRERLERLVIMGFLRKTDNDEYKPIEKEGYFRRKMGDLLEKEGYRVLEYLD